MQIVVIVFLGLSVFLYFLLGGADFGAGIIEMFTSSQNKSRTRKLTYQAIGPIWEANHMWLVIAIVILFVGFPKIYTTMTIYLHIPLLVMLLGIIARGTTFIFRHYDAVKDRIQVVYNKVFVYSSFITPLFLGIIAASILSGNINPAAKTFYGLYIADWWNLFSISVGFFTVALCGFLASIFLVGESHTDYDKKRYIHKTGVTNILAVLSGALVFLAAYQEHIPLGKWLFGNPVSRLALLAACLSLILLWYKLARGSKYLLRTLAGFQVTMILLAMGYSHFPNLLLFKNGRPLSLLVHTAPPATLQALGWALLGGSVLILPFLGYLFYHFQQEPEQ
ncbi:MAG: cytochrome d ubiquinol oxidase subunit II [Chitinophagaceae bacterium]